MPTQENRLELCPPTAGQEASAGSQPLPALPASYPCRATTPNIRASAPPTSVPPQEGFCHCQLPILHQVGLQAGFILGNP